GGVLAARLAKPEDVGVAEPDAARRRALKRRYGVRVSVRNARIAAEARVLVLAVKPQVLDAVLDALAPAISRRHLVVSIAAGKSLAEIEARLSRARVVRVMPNLPCQVGRGMSVYCSGSRATRADGATVRRFLSCFGRVLELPEAHFDAVTALSGSGPAFLAYCLDALAAGAEAEGLARGDALLLAEQTMLGTAALLLERGADPADLVEAVTSRGGTTAAGRAVLEKSGAVRRTLIRTVRAAADRSRALSRD
ncbi:MAG: pyrroline-5-carboxylate reductase, partial [Lentisphaerae bacterium]|nr:pyrroline-5-carboxylate reductase [Lentisphaerota bacterium]